VTSRTWEPRPFESLRATIASAERGEGWLSVCDDAGRYLVPTREFVASLAAHLRSLGGQGVLEVCAGRGELAGLLQAAGTPVVATDAAPPPGSAVVAASAAEALGRYRPAVVLGCFVPIDARVDALVLGTPSVRHYVVLGARLAGAFGSAALWQTSGWKAEPVDSVRRWMITRHDVWMGRELLQHGEAWHFRRTEGNEPHGALLTR
jgi:hypothetical protein